jgi:hypothetical protein
MGKGKGRQSRGFGRKALGAEWNRQWHQEVSTVNHNRRQELLSTSSAAASAHKERPRFAGLSQLKGLIRERQSYEHYELLEQRRRLGFVPARPKEHSETAKEVPNHPPGWMLQYGKDENDKESDATIPIAPLHETCLHTLARYLPEYLEVLGAEELKESLAFLPSDSLSELSTLVSQSHGMNNRLAYCIGAHTHVESLSFHAAVHKDETLSDEGLLSLVPTMPSRVKEHETWEDLDNDDEDIGCDLLQLEGVSMKLRRLELVNCSLVSFDAVEQLLSKCSWITHLSLAGSLTEDGADVLLQLPQWLPALQVLDLSNCAWVTQEIIFEFTESYPEGTKRPKIFSGGCVTNVYVSPREW